MKKNKKIILLILMMIAILPDMVSATEYLICDEKKIPAIVPQMSSTFMTIIKIAVPILLVISGMISFIKVTYSSNVEDDLKKAKTKLIHNIIAAVIVFFIFSLVNFAVSLVAGTGNSFMKCAKCFIDTDDCIIREETDSEINEGFINPPKTQIPDDKINQNLNPESNNESRTNNNSGTNNQSVQTGTNSETILQTVDKDGKKYDIYQKDGVTYIHDYKLGLNEILIVNKTYSYPKTLISSGGLDDCKEERCFNPNMWKRYLDMKKDYEKNPQTKFITRNDGTKETVQVPTLDIASGTRSYDYQNTLYNNYISIYGQAGADDVSARPGYSEHHTGFAFDLIEASTANMNGTPAAKWLNDNCYKYGFIIRYPESKKNVTGYSYESWHLRYVGTDLAKILYNNGNWITLEEYYGLTSQYSN